MGTNSFFQDWVWCSHHLLHVPSPEEGRHLQLVQSLLNLAAEAASLAPAEAEVQGFMCNNDAADDLALRMDVPPEEDSDDEGPVVTRVQAARRTPDGYNQGHVPPCVKH